MQEKSVELYVSNRRIQEQRAARKTYLLSVTVDLKENNPEPAYHFRLTKVWEVNNVDYRATTTAQEGN